jgi:hypothetical protein
LGFLWLDLSDAQGEAYSGIVQASIDKQVFDQAMGGDGIIVKGFEEGVTLKEQRGIIVNPWIFTEDFQQYMIWGTAEVYPGMSGGGVFDEDGYLLGILCGNNSEGDIAVLPLSIILAQFEGVEIG